MNYKNWEDDLLNFDYSDPVPQEKTSSRLQRHEAEQIQTPREVEDAIKREEERARQLREEYERIRQASRAQKVPQQSPVDSAATAAEKQQELYRQFREEYRGQTPVSKAQEGRAAKAAAKAGKAATNVGKKATGFYKFTRILSVPYVIALVAFIASMTIMNVLPFSWWIALIVVLGLLSSIIVTQLRKNNIKKWAKVLSTITATLLIVVFGVGSAYAMGTLSFLDNTSTVDNESKVAHITKEPFNVLITGMDVWGKIDEPGRSDVNMLVTVNPETETILMTSTPRDYEVQMPDLNYATDKLTHTGFYSVDTSIGAIENLYNTNVNYYVKVNFDTIVRFIDAVGGLDFQNDIEFESAITHHLYEKGFIHVQGRGALYYARERKAFLDGDRQRVRNQQIIFSEMLKKATSSRTMLLSYNKVLTDLNDYFEMSFSSREIRSLLKMQLAKNIKWKMYKNAVTGGDGHMATYSTGSTQVYVMTQDPESIANAQTLIQAVLEGKKLDKEKTEDGIEMVYVVDETAEDAA